MSDADRLNEELRASEERFRKLIRDLHVGVIVQGRRSEILISNPAALELLGLTEEQLLGKTSYDPSWNIVREDGTTFPAAERPVATSIATRQRVTNVVIGVDRPAHGDRVWLLINVEPEIGPDGEVAQVVATLGDITDRKRLEASLLQAQKLESIGRLAGGIAHDFNNLLTVIVGCTTLALRKLSVDTPARRDLEASLEAADRAATLTRRLLTFARRQVTVPKVVSLPEVLRDLEGLLVRLIGADIALSVNVPDSIWSVRIDPSQLEQALINLVVNARDAMPDGGSLTIDVDTVSISPNGGNRGGASEPKAPAKPQDYVRIRVTDTGHGIDRAARQHLFEPFFTTKALGHGTGLGLAMVHGIVQHSGGFVTVESELGNGAVFAVHLPRVDALPDGIAPSLERESVQGGRETILVAEDEPSLRALAVRVLADLGYTILEACDGQDALAQAAAHDGPIHLLLTDLVMPRMDGRTLAAALCALRPSVRVLYVSGYTDKQAPPEGARLLSKPYLPDELARAAREVLDAAPDAEGKPPPSEVGAGPS